MPLTLSPATSPSSKVLYDYYNTHKRNKGLLDILEGFSTNLLVSIDRLQKRDSLLAGKPNPALGSFGVSGEGEGDELT
ncbi:hypothetical protein RQP46_002532 [Phenoliferia psychrophenolica]